MLPCGDAQIGEVEEMSFSCSASRTAHRSVRGAFAPPPSAWLLLAAAFLGVVGCEGEGPPPFEALELRDLLLARPEAVLELSAARREELASRFDEEMRAQRVRERVGAAADGAEADYYVTLADERREASHQDVLVLVGVGPGGDAIELYTIELAGGDGGVAREPVDLELDLDIDDELLRAEPYASVLSGPARAPLVHLAHATGARGVRSREALRAAAAADGQTLYVNPAWLALYAETDETVGAQRVTIVDDVVRPDEPDHGGGIGAHAGRGLGCYDSGACNCSSTTCYSGSTCDDGCSWGFCGCDNRDGHHCTVARSPSRPALPVELAWLIAPALFLGWRARRR